MMLITQSRRDDRVIGLAFPVILIPKGWHDGDNSYDTPLGFINLVTIPIIISPLRGWVG